jgi:PAS domain S-box-containing protein
VARGDVDGWVGNRAVAKLQLDQNPNDFQALRIGDPIPDRQSILGIGTTKNNGILRDIFEKTLISLDPADIRQITEPWLEGTVSGRIPVTRDEQQWLSRHRSNPIRVLQLEWPPFDYTEDGELKGMSIEYIRYAFDILGLTPDFVTMSWPEAYDGIANFEKIDVLPTIAPSEERAQIVELTDPYLTFPMVIFTRNDAEFINGLDDLRGKTVAVEQGFIMDERLSDDYPNIDLRRFETTNAALSAVSLGEADAYVGNMAGGTFHIDRHGLSNLKVASPTEYGQDNQAFGVRRDWPELASLLQKVLNQMTDQEHAALRGTALAVRFDQGLDIKLVLTYALPAAAVVLIIIGVVVVSNRRLKSQVAERLKAEERLREREQWFKSLLESAPDATVIWDRHGVIVTANKQAETMFGVLRDDLIGQNVGILFPEDVTPKQLGLGGDFEKAAGSQFASSKMPASARRVDGTEVPVDINLCPIETAEGTLIAASLRDVTHRRKQEHKLKEQDLQLTAALENMSGGMFMMDKDQIIRVFNRKFVEMYMLPNIRVGSTIQDIVKARAERGDYGSGDVKQLMAERLAGYNDRSITRIEDRLPNGATIEVYRQPTSDGGMVCMTNDITMRKRVEESLAAQTRQLQNLSEKLSRYLSPQIYEAIFAGAADANVATARKKLTVFFSDIRNFTATTEEMEPEDMTFLLNDYLTKMTEIALEYGGTIDKYIGDAIMVFFGDPETKGVKQDALAAVRMAVAMQRRMVDLRAKWADMGYRLPFHIRCGINTGYCNVGNFGSDQRVDYTIIGGQVNLAARLESITDPDGITISYETYSLVRDEFDADPQEPIQVKGISEPVRPYAVNGIFEDWDSKERYIRSDDILGLRLWVDLMRLNDEQRAASITKLEETIDVLRNATQSDAAE